VRAQKQVWSSSSEPKRLVDEAATATARADGEKKKGEAEAKGEPFTEPEPAQVMKTEYETKWGWKVQNDNKPIWVRNPKDVEKDSYNEFYKTTFKEFMDPLAHLHFSIEGDIEFKAILFMPGMAPFDQQDWMRKSRSIKLYVRRVFISDQFDEDLMPRYLNFIKARASETSCERCAACGSDASSWACLHRALSTATTCRSTCRVRFCRSRAWCASCASACCASRWT
jgi:heat shock protein beta